jgi:hypothetical protein
MKKDILGVGTHQQIEHADISRAYQIMSRCGTDPHLLSQAVMLTMAGQRQPNSYFLQLRGGGRGGREVLSFLHICGAHKKKPP